MNGAAEVLRSINPDVILFQEMKDYNVCARLGELIKPHTYQVAICSAFTEGGSIGKQQVAILAKEPAQAAWSERWKSMEGVDPPRGFAFGWFKIHGSDVGIYSVHLKSNLIMRGDKTAETAKNIRKREVAAHQLINHMQEVVAAKMPYVRSIVVGGDFNTSVDEFANEATMKTLIDAGFANCMETLPAARRVTHPGGHGYPDATFDYFFARNATLGSPQITSTKASDHLPVTCEVTIPTSMQDVARSQSTEPLPTQSPTASPALLHRTIRLTKPITVQVPYGQVVIQPRTELPVIERRADTVWIKYLGQTYPIPVTSTDVQ